MYLKTGFTLSFEADELTSGGPAVKNTLTGLIITALLAMEMIERLWAF
jgi:hypothetical protein